MGFGAEDKLWFIILICGFPHFPQGLLNMLNKSSKDKYTYKQQPGQNTKNENKKKSQTKTFH